MPRRISSNSWFRWILSAWNVSFAGCMAWYSLPLAAATSDAKAFVVLGRDALSRATTTASATRRAALGSEVSPYSPTMRISSSRSTVFKNSYAGTPFVRSNRRSSGPSCSGRNPRPWSSNCGDEMPRSRNTPAGRTPSGASTLSMHPNGAWWIVNLSS